MENKGKEDGTKKNIVWKTKILDKVLMKLFKQQKHKTALSLNFQHTKSLIK